MRRILNVVAALAVVVAPSLSDSIEIIPIKQKGAGPLFQIHRGRKWGYMNRNGRTVIAPQFDWEGDFFGGLARVKLDGKWGFTNEHGLVVIPFQFDEVGDFREGFAPVRVERKWGYIDSTGRFTVALRFQGAAGFHDGLARIEVWDTATCGNTTYTNVDAPLSIFVVFRPPCVFVNRYFGFINYHGDPIVPPHLSDAQDFSEGFAGVRFDSSQTDWGFIDKTGASIIRPQFVAASPFSEGLAAVQPNSGNSKGKWGFIDRTGSYVIAAKFGGISNFSEGLAAASGESGLYGFINRRGIFVIPPRFMVANDFSKGLALVRPNSDMGLYYIDKAGRKALQLKLWARWSFSDGLTVAGDSSIDRVYVDRKGHTVAPYEVDPQW